LSPIAYHVLRTRKAIILKVAFDKFLHAHGKHQNGFTVLKLHYRNFLIFLTSGVKEKKQ
jgi:hypothetical protein